MVLVTRFAVRALSVTVLSLGCAAFARSSSKLGWVDHTPAQSPSPRAAMASAFDESNGKLVVFGGYDATSYLRETWTYDGTTWTKEQPSRSPSGRAGAAMAYDAVDHVLVLFGGFDGAHYLGDTWIWDGALSDWMQVTPAHAPTAVTGPMLFTDPLDGHVDNYGGFGGQFYQLKTWRWTGSDWQDLNTPTSAWARAAAAVGLDRGAHKVVMFGGLGSVNTNNTWTFDGVTWTLENPTAQPLNRYDASADFDPELGHVVLFGGASGGVEMADTWTWTGDNWVQLHSLHAPRARESFALAYDRVEHSLVLFGGEDQPAGAQYADTQWLVLRN